jgi:hypothetical protein
LLGPMEGITAMALSADAHWLVTGDGVGKVQRWALSAVDPWATRYSLPGHEVQIMAMAFSADGRWLVIADAGGKVRRWVFLQNELVQLAQRGTGRNLDQNEWDRYFSQEPCRKTFPDLPNGCAPSLGQQPTQNHNDTP